MNPFVEGLLFLLKAAHASGNYPQGEAQKHIDAIEAFNQPAVEAVESKK